VVGESRYDPAVRRSPIFALATAVLAGHLAAQSPRDRTNRTPAPASRREAAKTGAGSLGAQDLAARARGSVLRIRTRGRDGPDEGVGTGFVVGTNGLVATCLHVIGEGRPLEVRFPDGSKAAVLAVHAWDRGHDLAILRIDRTGLPALPLGDADPLPQGAPLVALGHPLGLEYSVVEGVLSGRRELEGQSLLQLAIPIEPGNSGGPVLDRSGKVQGILNAKSLLTRNLGFAIPVNRLLPLLENPSPIPFDRWLRLGEPDPERWTPHLGASWRQRSGRIVVEGAGSGFGGRTYLLAKTPAPGPDFHLRTTVRLQDDSGAAGLVFGDDGAGRHFGFYPTGGNLRLTAFDGPDVNSWRILGTVPSSAYRPGEWNRLEVRSENGRLRCRVNGETVFDREEKIPAGKAVGLAAFRGTGAEFREFVVEPPPAAGSDTLSPEVISAFTAGREPVDALRTNLPAAEAFLGDRARRLEDEALRLRGLAQRLRRETARDALVQELAKPDGSTRLARAVLLLAAHDQPGLDVEACLRELDTLADRLRPRVAAIREPAERVAELRRFLFEEEGFHGSRSDYRNNANSHLNRVLDDREGIPITLAIVFLEVGRAAGIGDLQGLPLPGHFLVKHSPAGADPRLYDPYHGGIPILFSAADELGSESAGVPVRSELMEPATRRGIVVRMVNNLRAFNLESEGIGAALPYSDLLVALANTPASEATERLDRARLLARSGNRTAAADDLRKVLALEAPGIDLDRVATALRALESEP
jgi:serine protease Do